MKNSNFTISFLTVLLLLFTFAISTELISSEQIITPEQHFGFKPGSDRMMFDYENLISYLEKLDKVSPRLKLVEVGISSLGRKIYIAFISSEENINKLDQLKSINKKLALDPNIPDAERKSLIKDGKVFFLATLSMHSGEVGPSQSAPIIAYDLVTAKDSKKLTWLNDVVYMMVPCHNPDGMNMIVNHYKKYKGTKYEGCNMPGVYHKYIGHDINRDFITLLQSENKAVGRIYNTEWYPQVMIEKHQMGSGGARYFVPPMHDPITENVDASIWNWTWVFGSNMSNDMTKKGLSGVSQHYLFDDYWPGSTETCIWKNVIGMLTEAASAKYATPIYVEPNELSGYGKGLSEYKKSINFPLPWPGGWWRLSDIIEYEIVSTMSILKTASLHREDILKFRNDICKSEVKRGRTEAPYFYILPQKQHDKSEFVNLVNLLKEHGVNVYLLTKDIVINNVNFYMGDVVVPLAQAYRPFIKEVMESQKFPLRHYTPDGKVIKPYDITSWSLPLHRDVKAIEINSYSKKLNSVIIEYNPEYNLKIETPNDFWAAAFSVNNNESYKAAFHGLKNGLKINRLEKQILLEGKTIPKGSFIIENSDPLSELLGKLNVSPVFIENKMDLITSEFKVPRIALVETYFHDMDAGWSRYIFDNYAINYKVVHPGEFKTIDFKKNFDVVIFPDADKSVLFSGKYKREGRYSISSYPPEYTKGIGKEGMANIMTFIDNGGIIISWGRSTDLFMDTLTIKHGKDDSEEFQLPIRNTSKKLKEDGLYCPGSFVKVLLKKDHPITLGMQDEIGVFFRGRPVFQTSTPIFDMDRRVIGKFPEDKILLSGYCEKVDKLSNKSSLVWLKKGKGQFVLFGFNPQFRASTQGTFKLLFNSILLPELN